MRRPSIYLLIALLGGCAGQGADTRGSLGRDARGVALPDAAQALFERPGVVQQVLPDSPWGSGVTVVLQDAYAAASGRRCRAFLVRGLETAPTRGVVPGLACRNGDGAWVEARRLHHHGRPVLEAAR